MILELFVAMCIVAAGIYIKAFLAGFFKAALADYRKWVAQRAMEQLTSAQFLEKLRESSDWSVKIAYRQHLELLTPEDGIVRYLGPEPIEVGYVDYMAFLAEVEDVTGSRVIVNSYLGVRCRE